MDVNWNKQYKEAQAAIRQYLKDLNIHHENLNLKDDDVRKLLYKGPILPQSLIDQFRVALAGLQQAYQTATGKSLSSPQETALRNLRTSADNLFEANKYLRQETESKKSVSAPRFRPYSEEDVCKTEDYDLRFDPPLPAPKSGTDQEQVAQSLLDAVEKLSAARNRYRAFIGVDDQISKELEFILKLRLIPSLYATTSFTTVMSTVSNTIATLVGAEVTKREDTIRVDLLTEISGAILETVKAYHRLTISYGLNSAEIEAARQKAKERCCGKGGCSILSQIH